jgi:hypothetical protein
MDLLNLPWFRRTWTVQELVLAREAIVLLGAKSIPWKSLRSALLDLQERDNFLLGHSVRKSVSNPASFHDELWCYSTLANLSCTSYVPHENLMSTSLKVVRTKKSSNPKDKVYGLYGILDQMKIPHLPKVDYTKSVQQIYTEIARATIENDKSLDILQELRLPSSVLNLPSWVPDWSNTDYMKPISYLRSASMDSKASWEFCGSELTVVGTLIDELTDIAPSSSISTPEFRRGYNARRNDLGGPSQRRLATTELVLTLQAWVRHSRRLNTYPTGCSVMQAFFFLLGGSARLIEDRRPRMDDLEDFEDFVSILMADDPNNNISLTTLYDAVRYKPGFKEIKEDFIHIFGCSTHIEDWSDEMKIRLFLKVYSPAVASLQHDVSLNTYHRTFFTTKDGYMGIGPRWARSDDSVALVAGLRMPFVVRGDGSKYRIIGPARIHGVELGERWDESQLEMLTFV